MTFERCSNEGQYFNLLHFKTQISIIHCSINTFKLFFIFLYSKIFREKTGSTAEKSDTDEASRSEAQRRQSIFPGKRTEKWDIPLDERSTFQQQVNKIAELKCTYSRPNAKVRWYKDRKEIFSGGLKYKIVINKAEIALIINNPDTDDSGKYTCEANGIPTHSMVTVEGEFFTFNEYLFVFVDVLEPPMKYVFLIALPNTQEIYRTKQAVLTCKLNSARAPVTWYRAGKPVDL